MCLTAFHIAYAVGRQNIGLFAYRIHLIFADVGRQYKTPGIFFSSITHFDGQVHFRQLARNMSRHHAKLTKLLWKRRKNHAQLVELLVDGFQRFVVRLQVNFIAREQVTSLAGFCIQHALHQFVQCATGTLRPLHVVD